MRLPGPLLCVGLCASFAAAFAGRPCGHAGDGAPGPCSGTARGVDEFEAPPRWTTGVRTLEDFYDRESGSKFQIAFGFRTFDGTPNLPAIPSYGAALDDVTVEWSESHPIEQGAGEGCGQGTCSAGDPERIDKLCFNADDCGAGGVCTGAGGTATASCAGITWGTNTLFSGSGTVALNVVDFNARTTQGGFDCTRHGFSSACGSCQGQAGCNACTDGAAACCTGSNDCDNDGLTEVEVTVTVLAEPTAERFRLEQTAAASADHTALVAFSSSLADASDGVVFLQFNGTANPTVTASYFDRDAGVADVNGDGTPDSPPSNGRDFCPGFCGFDDDKNAVGADNRPGVAIFDDDGNGICDFKSTNVGAFCVRNSNCTGGGASCLNTDEGDELCGRLCTGGTGLCKGGGSAGLVCTTDGNCPGGLCARANCISNLDCAGGGTCATGKCYNGVNNGLACMALPQCPGGYCGRDYGVDPTPGLGDDDCRLIDNAAETCAIVAGRLVAGIDDNCGCAQNPLTANLVASFATADIIVQSFAFTDTPPNGTGDGDGFADDNELISLDLTLRNISSLDIDDVSVRLSSQTPTIRCINDPIARYGRINKFQSAGNGSDLLQFTIANVSRASMSEDKQGTLSVTITGIALNPDGTRTPVEGTSTPQTFTFDLDLDLDTSGAPPVATTTKTFSFEASQYPDATAWNADWAHTYFSDQPNLHCQYNDPRGLLARSAPVGCFLQQDTPGLTNDDWHLHANVPGGQTATGDTRDSGDPGICSGGKLPGSACSQSQDCVGGCTGAFNGQSCLVTFDCPGVCSNDPLIRCTANVTCRFCSNDHSIPCTSPINCPGGSCDPGATCNGVGTCTNPSPGTCNGLGSACMHMGLHFGPLSSDTIHLNNIFYTYFKGDDLGGGVRKPLQIGLGQPGTDDPPVLSFWHQMALIDERAIGNLSEPYTLDAGVVHILQDRNDDGTQQIGPPSDTTKDGWWEKTRPFYGAPRQQRYPAGNCSYDPNDDGNDAKDLYATLTPQNGRATGPSSTCYPEFVWACVGDTQDPPYNPGAGQTEPNAICFPEVDANDAPVFRGGPGIGRWVQSKVDLSRYRGRKIWFRFLTSHFQFTWPWWTFAPGGAVGGNRDDGWYVDDIRVSGTTPTAMTLQPDSDPPPASSCPSVLCSGLNARFTGSTFVTQHDGIDNDGNGNGNPTCSLNPGCDETDDGAAGTVASDAPLRNVALNGQDDGVGAAGPSTGTCINGVLQYRFWEDRDADDTLDPGELIRDFTESPRATANPIHSHAIKMDARCSSDPGNAACQSRADLTVNVAGEIAPITIFVGAPGSPQPEKDTLMWDSQFQAVSYDVMHRRFDTDNFTRTFDGCFGGVCSDGTNPGTCCRQGGTECTGGGTCNIALAFQRPGTLPTGCLSVCEQTGTAYDIGCRGTPPLGFVDMWIVRSRGTNWVTTWNEVSLKELADRDPQVPNPCP